MNHQKKVVTLKRASTVPIGGRSADQLRAELAELESLSQQGRRASKRILRIAQLRDDLADREWTLPITFADERGLA